MSTSGEHARWLVTGAGGQLGGSMLSVAVGEGIEVVGVAHGELDIANSDEIARALDEHAPDVVLNAAAYTKVDLCEDELATAHRINAVAPGLLAAQCKGRALLVHMSTEYVFPGEASLPIPEDGETRPLSVYGQSKLDGERAVTASGCEHLIVRTQWLFGPGANFVRTILGVAARGQALRVVEDQVGRPTWTTALAPGIVASVRAELRGTLHLACEGLCSWYDFAREIVAEGSKRGLCDAVQVDPIPTSEMPRPATRPAFAVLGLERARAAGIVLPHWRDALPAHLDAEAS